MTTPKYFEMVGDCPICGGNLPEVNIYMEKTEIETNDDGEVMLMDSKTFSPGDSGDAEIFWESSLQFAERCEKCKRAICPDCYMWYWEKSSVICKECLDGNFLEEKEG